MTRTESPRRDDFIRAMVEEDVKTNRFGGQVVTRFPPEPNGYLHIGHALSTNLNFGIATDYGGRCHLRFDDTNPAKEGVEYVESIKEDVRWIGWDWGEHLYFASDYFESLYGFAVRLVEKGVAYVDDLTAEEIREYRGTLTKPGKNSPYRDRSVEENLDLFARMKAGQFEAGTRVLRARIDMASGNINMRDPVLYRILKASHHRTGDTWSIYPMYDMAHGQCDSIEGVTHSVCSIEYEDHRPLYNWLLDQLEIYHPRQIEFARLNVSHTVLSKRKLVRMVREGSVSGWDDPRMPTISGLRRRGYTPEALRSFCTAVGVAKRYKTADIAMLEHAIREDLNKSVPRVMAVLQPLKIVIYNYPEDRVEELTAVNNPEDPSMGTRQVPFSRELYIERDDFQEEPHMKFRRLAPGREVRLRYGYFITCVDVIKDKNTDEVTELHCTYDPKTRGGQAPDGRKVRGTIHWVSARNSIEAEVRLYDHLFTVEKPDDAEDYMTTLNPHSLEVKVGCRLEPSLKGAEPGDRYQFERLGYFCVDSSDSKPDALVFNRTVSLRDTWTKLRNRQ